MTKSFHLEHQYEAASKDQEDDRAKLDFRAYYETLNWRRVWFSLKLNRTKILVSN